MEKSSEVIDEVESLLNNEEYEQLRMRLVPLMERYHLASLHESIEATAQAEYVDGYSALKEMVDDDDVMVFADTNVAETHRRVQESMERARAETGGDSL